VSIRHDFLTSVYPERLCKHRQSYGENGADKPEQYDACRFNYKLLTFRSRNSDWLRAGRPRGWSSSPGGINNFHFSMSSRPALGSTQPPIQCVPGALSRGYSGRGRETDHSPPTSAVVKKMWIYTFTPPYVFMA
jgi:hypothetical protein